MAAGSKAQGTNRVMKGRGILIVPAEVKAREFYSRLYFSAKAVVRGYTVLFGRSTDLHSHLHGFPKGIIVENDVTPRGYNFIARARSLGYGVVAWDEEAFVTITDEIYAEYRIAEETLGRVSLFFTRGPGDTAAIAAKYPHMAEKLREVGNPRLDVLRPNIFQHSTVRCREPGGIILFSSRFSGVNPYDISPERARQNRLSKYGLLGKDTAVSRAFNRHLDHKLVNFEHCRKLVGALAEAFPEKTVIVRPHPSEGRKTWEEVAQGHRNCEVRGDGSAIDWILKAEVLVHNSCTTAIEANLLGVPTVNFLPNFDDICDNYLTNFIGPQCHDTPSVIDAIKATELGGAEEIAARSGTAREKYAPYFAGLGRTDASDLILDEIDVAQMKAEPWNWRLRVFLNTWKTQLKHSVKQLVVRPSPELLEAKKGYNQQKFPQTNEQEIAGALKQFGYGAHRVDRFADQWFRISGPAN
jgi:surface carbohydrate biosynthesis protein